MYLLDTDILSNLMKRSPSVPLLAKVASVPPRQQHTSSVTLGELIYGANRLRQRSTKLLDQIDKLVTNLPVLPFDAAAARRYGKVRALLESRGTPVGDADLRIAAIALASGLTVVTANTRHFERIPELMVFDDFLGSYSELRDLRPYPKGRGHGLLLAVYRHALQEVEAWLRDVIESLADPMAALQKRGLPTSGDVELELSLTFTTPKELGEFREWMKRKTKAAKKTAKRRKKQRLEMERRDEEARIEEEGRQIALGGLVTLVVGICLGGLFFGGDGED